MVIFGVKVAKIIRLYLLIQFSLSFGIFLEQMNLLEDDQILMMRFSSLLNELRYQFMLTLES